MWKKSRGCSEAASDGVQWGQEQTRAFYERVLEEAGEIANKSVSKGFEDNRRTWHEFTEYLHQVGKDPQSCTGLDVVVFLQGDWLPRHRQQCRTVSKDDGGKVASASAIKGVIAHLSKSFSTIGRQGNDNPAQAEAVRNFRDGYRNWLHDKGVQEKRAVTFSEGKVLDLVASIEKQILQSSGLQECCLIGDLAIVHYLWESLSRGKECGQLERRQVSFGENMARPGWSKTVRQEPSAEISLGNNFLEAAGRLIRACEDNGVPVGQGYLFRPLNEKRNGFKSEAMSSGSMRRRIQQRLKDANLFEGETLHSFRHSAVQHAAEIEGYDVEKLMKLGRWTSYSAFRL